MDDTEQEQFDNDDVEITDLPEEAGGSHRPGYRRVRAGAEQAPPLLRGLFHPPLSPRQRFLQLATMSVSLALIALIILAGSASTRNALLTGIFGRQPTPTPTLFPGTNLFYIQGTPSWGRAILDGHTLARLPVVGKDQPLQLSRGRHVLQWRAAPFLLQTCIVAIPPTAGSNNCEQDEAVQLKSGFFAAIIRFSETLDSLPPDQFVALANAAQSAVNGLQSTTMVEPGEQYIDTLSDSDMATASEPMHATLNFQLDIASASNAPCVSSLARSVILSCQDCREFCTAPDQAFPATPINQPWNVLALIAATWKFMTLDGHIVEQNQPDTSDEHLIELQITWDGTYWHVKAPISTLESSTTDNPICESAQEEIGMNGYFGQTGGNVEEAVVWQQFASESKLADGCLAVGIPQQNSPEQPRLPTAYLLYRFGVVVAGNQAAYNYWASQPLADSYERHLVQQIITQISRA
ncbi:MAG TPA: hypothetical protein VFA09_27355 [Ktedonobacteraceae bacterium]|nr:hypothetical protein [Ktedonobacteraceae bacterium]